ncbi:hypothetical protein [Nannocystis exedens]|uniref:hypothetical protein n=1 Tax=Nannocystis exedens TaxID=54 RepID=UPI000BBA0BBE|nr:hypothetical protein [Nannocystis exedens]
MVLSNVLVMALAGCNNPTPAETDSDTSTGTTTDGTETDPSATNATPATEPTDSSPTTTDPATDTETTAPTTAGPTTEPSTDTDTTDTDTTDTDTTGEPVSEVVRVWATANPPLLEQDRIVALSPALDAATATLTVMGDVVSIESVAVTQQGHAIITYDAPNSTGGVIIKTDLADNPADGPLGLGDRVIRGPATGLVTPKGVEVGPMGTFLVADTGAPSIKVFEFDAEGDVAPTFEITDLGGSEAVWDVHYVANDDVLYAAGTNGEVQVYEDFSNAMGQTGPDRTIVPVEAGTKVSVNLHGITVVGDNLFLSDVGDPMETTDGQLFRIADPANADGDVEVAQRIEGGDLGNPVDLEVTSGGQATLWVVEKANDKLLRYRPSLLGEDFELVDSIDVSKPESVALATNNRLILAANPAGLDLDAVLEVEVPLIGAPAVSATIDRLGSITSIQSIALAGADGLVGFDGTPASDGAGVFSAPAIVDAADGTAIDAIGTRIWGPGTGLVAPKGMTLNAAGDRLFVADLGDSSIKVFDPVTFGDAPPLFVIAELGGGAVWDIDYDDANDRLFAAGVDGTVRVFDAALADEGASGPARTFTPANDNDEVIGVNLHGIQYDPASKTLFLTDVGDVMSDSDGAIYLIADADAAEGNVAVTALIAGDQTHLGNPVDLAFDGKHLYVAEKAQSRVLRYSDILGLTGAQNVAEDAFIEVTNAESVRLEFSKP